MSIPQELMEHMKRIEEALQISNEREDRRQQQMEALQRNVELLMQQQPPQQQQPQQQQTPQQQQPLQQQPPQQQKINQQHVPENSTIRTGGAEKPPARPNLSVWACKQHVMANKDSGAYYNDAIYKRWKSSRGKNWYSREEGERFKAEDKRREDERKREQEEEEYYKKREHRHKKYKKYM